MSKQKVKLERLSDAQVSWLSVVDSGAARTAFKIQKAEKPGGGDMLHFKVDDLFQDPAFESRVLAVAVAPDVAPEGAKTLIEKAGLKADERREIEGAAVYEQGEGALESGQGQVVTVKLNEQVAVVCDVAKSFSPWTGSTDFDENLKSLGFLPSFELGVDALRTTTFEVLQKAESRKDAAKGVSEAAEAFSKHVKELTAALPDEVFKLEDVLKADLAEGVDHLSKPATGNEQFSGDENPTASSAPNSGANAQADKTAGEEGNTALAGSQAAADVEKAEKERTEARKAAFEALGLTPEAINAIEMVIKKQGGISASGVATGDSGTSQPGSRPEVDGKSDQETSGESLAGPSNDASSSMPGASPQSTGVTKEELMAALATALEPLKGLGAEIETLKTQVAETVAKAEEAGAAAARGLVLGEPAGDDGEGTRAEVRFQEPPLMDTGVERQMRAANAA